MDFVREYWLLILIAALAALVLGFLLVRPRQRVRLTDSAPIRPHMASRRLPEGRGLAGEAVAATSDVAGELLRAPVRRELDGETRAGNDLCQIKGVGPKFAAALQALGFTRFEQLAHLTPEEIERLDRQLGPFAGRIQRDRIVEQAAYLARGDLDGFQERFGKL